jgi:hypothetical protein
LRRSWQISPTPGRPGAGLALQDDGVRGLVVVVRLVARYLITLYALAGKAGKAGIILA